MHLSMGVFGGVWANSDSGPQRPGSATQSKVLSRLALTPRQPVSFEAIAEAIWPNQPFADVRHLLQVHVSGLRKWLRVTCGAELADQIETRRNAYRLNAPAGHIDWEAFGERITDGQLAMIDKQFGRAIEMFRSALELWDEPFVEFDGHDAANAQVSLLRSQRELAEDELSEAQLLAGSTAETVATLEARALQHPYREHTHRQLMRALYAIGRHDDAIAVFERIDGALRDDLGIDPGPELQAVHTAVQTGTLVVAPSHTSRAPADPDASDTFPELVGRDEELATIRRALATPGTVLVWGEAGSGKSRLLHDVMAATIRDAPERRWIECCALHDRSASPLWFIRHALGVEADDDATDVYDLNAEMIRELGSSPGTVLTIDDFQWADEATIDFVSQLARSPRLDSTIVLALRSAEIDATGSAGRAATTMGLLPGSTSVVLEPLGLDAISQLAERAQSSVPASVLLERSGGNALYVTELLRSRELLGASGDVPYGVSAVLDERLTAVAPSAARVLSVAAVIGQRFEIDLLIRVAGESVERVVEAVAAGRSLGIVTNDEHEQATFTHALIVDALAARLTQVERCRLHDAIAAVLERRADGSSGGPERATHHALAAFPLGDPHRAVRLSRQSGHASAARLSFADARGRYAAAIDAAGLLDDDDRAAIMPALLRELGTSTVGAGMTEEGQELLRRAIRMASEAGDDELVISATAGLVEGPSPLSVADDETIDLVTQAVERTDGAVTVERSLMLAWLAGVRYFSHDLAHCRSLADEALAIADTLDDAHARAYARFGKWLATLGPEDATERRTLAEEVRAHAAVSGSLVHTNFGHTMGASTAFELGLLAEARQLVGAATDRIADVQAPRLSWAVDGYNVLLAIAEGNLEEAELVAQRTVEHVGDSGNAVNVTNAMRAFGAQLVNIRLLQQRGAEAAGLLDDLVAAEPDQVANRAAWITGLVQAKDDRSSELVHNMIDRAIDARTDVLTTPALGLTAEALWLLTQRGEAVDESAAQRLVERIRPFEHMHVHINVFGTGGFYWGSLLHGLAQAQTAAGDRSTAAVTFRRAIDEHQAVGAREFEQRSRSALIAL